MPRSLLVPLSLALVCPSALAAPDPTLERAQAEAQRALASAGSPQGAAALLRLSELRDEIADPSVVDGPLQRISADRHADPFTRTAASLLALDVERAEGRVDAARRALGKLGFIQSVYVLGGFDNDGKAGCATELGPEKTLDLGATYPAKGHDATWRKLRVASLDGTVDLSTAIRPNRTAVVYALALLDERTPRRTTFALGASGAWRLWVNGERVASDEAYHPARPDQARISVQLRRGVNRVLVKVCQDADALGLVLRDESGRARAVLPDRLPPLAGGPPAHARPLPTLTSVLQRRLASRPDDTALRADLAVVLNASRAFEDKEHTDAVEAERAAADAARAGTPEAALELLAARLQTDDVNLRRRHLEAALEADPGSPQAAAAMALQELAANQPDRALARMLPWTERLPRFAQAQLLRARAEDELGDAVSAVLHLESLDPDLSRIPEVARERVRVARRLDRTEEAVQRLRAVLELRPGDVGALRSLSALLADHGNVAAAVALHARVLSLQPFDLGTRLRLAELLVANGRLDEGIAAFDAAQAISPDEADVYERKGRALLAAGRRNEALASFDLALQLRPQNPALKEALRTLRGGSAAYGAADAYDLKPLAEEANRTSEDAVYLADFTYVRVQASGLSSRFHQLGVKVFTQRGVDAFRSFPITYSPTRQEVRVVRARVTKPDGAVVESFGDTDRNLNEPWSGLYYDERAKVLTFPGLATGDVLEIQYRVEDTASDNLLSDYWGDLVYVQSTAPKLRWQYVVDMPASRPLYWNAATLGRGVRATKELQPDGRVQYRFAEASVPRVAPEPAMPGWSEVASTLHVSTYQTWEQVGRYYWNLIRDQLHPDASIRNAVNTTLKGVDRRDTREVVRRLYEFVVTNTRYVALEFGIHGFKPYRVDRILARRFGDCKDKASLLYALLRVAGVDSRIVLLRMRQLGAVPPEPASLAVFNHAILYVPSLDWYLDGTAEFHGATELPGPDRRADILIIEPEAPSRYTRTPEAKPDQNRTEVDLTLALRPGGGADVKGTSRVHGTAAPEYRRSYQSAATRRSTFEQGWSQTFPGLSVEKLSVSDPTRLDQDVSLDYQMNIPRFAELAPEGLRFYPFGNRRAFTEAYAPILARRDDLVLGSPNVSRFSFTYALPNGYAVGILPPDVATDSSFGRLVLRYHVADGRLVCEGELVFSQDRILAKDYPAFRSFVVQVDQAFSRRVTVRGPPGPPGPQALPRQTARPAPALN